MRNLKVFAVVIIMNLAVFQSTNADFISVGSLKKLCAAKNALDIGCELYVRGVVEGWFTMYIAEHLTLIAVKTDIFRYGPRYCETIGKVSSVEWMKIVRKHLKSMKPSSIKPVLASGVVMKAISKQLCE